MKLSAGSSSTPDNRRCRWPECACYSPQGPGICQRAGVYTNSKPGKAWNEAYKLSPAGRAALSEDQP